MGNWVATKWEGYVRPTDKAQSHPTGDRVGVDLERGGGGGGQGTLGFRVQGLGFSTYTPPAPQTRKPKTGRLEL